MSGEIEWETSTPPSAPHEPVDGGQQLRFLARAAVIACAAAAAAAALAFASPGVTSGHGTSPHTPNANSPGDSLFAGNGNIELVRSTADDPAPLADYVRPDSPRDACTQVPPGTAPDRAIIHAVQAALPGYQLRDVGRTLDEFAALCNLTLRAADAHGTVLVIAVAAPSPGADNPFTQIVVSSTTDAGTAITTAQAVTTGGWSVTVGTVGPGADQPSVATLLSLAQNPAVRW